MGRAHPTFVRDPEAERLRRDPGRCLGYQAAEPEANVARERVPSWVVWVMVIAISSNAFASLATKMTIGLMHTVSAFALRVRAGDERIIPYYNLAPFR